MRNGRGDVNKKEGEFRYLVMSIVTMHRQRETPYISRRFCILLNGKKDRDPILGNPLQLGFL